MKPSLFKNSVSLFLLAVSLSACYSPAPERSVPFESVQIAPVTPPQVIPEEWMKAEDPTEEIWRPGYWTYNGTDFVWNPGRLMVRPDPTAVWSNDRWEERGYGWAFVPGYWQ